MAIEKNKDRSYLFGRLLAVLDQTEEYIYNRVDSDEQRVTNSQKFWSSYTNLPAKTMQTLIKKTKNYERELRNANPEYFYKLDKERETIINLLNDNYLDSLDMNTSLSYYFIFGFYAEKQFLRITK